MVINRSFLLPIVLADIIAGIEHANPPTIGITDLPFNPTFRSVESIRKLMRDTYPVSSSMPKNKNKSAI